MLKKDELPECPVATFLKILGSKWKIYILQKLLERPHRFNELKNSIQGISQKVLTDSLRQLEEDKIISRKVYEDSVPKVEYFLSEIGEKMRPLILEIHKFGIYYNSQKK